VQLYHTPLQNGKSGILEIFLDNATDGSKEIFERIKIVTVARGGEI